MFRFSIRELLLLTLVAAMALGWWVHANTLSRQLARCSKHVRIVDARCTAMCETLKVLGCNVRSDDHLITIEYKLGTTTCESTTYMDP